ncbi:Hypothetical protein HVR_LOCUS1123 [uncultured virus]|nr:Hypothetical protein HVR_LOCUS1123 [uncultured virus]
MLDAIAYKFTSDPKLTQMLKDTYPDRLEEASVKDSFWGNGIGYPGSSFETITQACDSTKLNPSRNSSISTSICFKFGEKSRKFHNMLGTLLMGLRAELLNIFLKKNVIVIITTNLSVGQHAEY